MDEIGPATLSRIKAVKKKIESVGRQMGIPDDQALSLVEIDSRNQLREELQSLHADTQQWHREAVVQKGIVRKVFAYLAGLLKAEG